MTKLSTCSKQRNGALPGFTLGVLLKVQNFDPQTFESTTNKTPVVCVLQPEETVAGKLTEKQGVSTVMYIL